MKIDFKFLSIIAVITFIVNLIWENLQAPLYAGYESFSKHFWTCFRGSLGDVVIVLAFYLLFAGIYCDFYWIKKLDARKTTYLVVAGALIAIIIEYAAITAGRWSYAAMPLLPLSTVGVYPVLQMMILPIATFKIAWRLYNKK
jgi:hypothetical protein